MAKTATNPETHQPEKTVAPPARTTRRHLMWGMKKWEDTFREVLARPDVNGDPALADCYMRGLATAIRTLDSTDIEP